MTTPKNNVSPVNIHTSNELDKRNWNTKSMGVDDRSKEQYTVYFSRNKQNDTLTYEIVIGSDGSFAARRLDNGYIMAGYDASLPELTIEDAARRVYKKQDNLRQMYIRGAFSDVMRCIIQQYYQCESAMVQIENWEPARFPEGRIRLDV